MPSAIWETMPYQAQGVNWVAFDHGGTCDLAGFHIWNVNVTQCRHQRHRHGVSSMTVLTSADNVTWAVPSARTP